MPGDQSNINRARELRGDQTDAEKLLWARLRNKQLKLKFRRQQPVGPFIVDFISFEGRLIIEIDGGQHNDENTKKRDVNRTKYLKGSGCRVLRFWNNDVLRNIDGVLEEIAKAIDEDLLPSP